MAKTIDAVLEVLPARRMWNRNVGQYYIPISAQEQDRAGEAKRFNPLGLCFHTQGSYSSQSGDRQFDFSDTTGSMARPGKLAPLESLDRLWMWLWEWIAARRKHVHSWIKGDPMWGCVGGVAWRHVFWKLKAELRKMWNPRPIQRFKYDALSYAQNFDDGCWQDQEFHSLAVRFTATSSTRACS